MMLRKVMCDTVNPVTVQCTSVIFNTLHGCSVFMFVSINADFTSFNDIICSIPVSCVHGCITDLEKWLFSTRTFWPVILIISTKTLRLQRSIVLAVMSHTPTPTIESEDISRDVILRKCKDTPASSVKPVSLVSLV